MIECFLCEKCDISARDDQKPLRWHCMQQGNPTTLKKKWRNKAGGKKGRQAHSGRQHAVEKRRRHAASKLTHYAFTQATHFYLIQGSLTNCVASLVLVPNFGTNIISNNHNLKLIQNAKGELYLNRWYNDELKNIFQLVWSTRTLVWTRTFKSVERMHISEFVLFGLFEIYLCNSSIENKSLRDKVFVLHPRLLL